MSIWKFIEDEIVDRIDDPITKTMTKTLIKVLVVVITGLITRDIIKSDLTSKSRDKGKTLYGYVKDVQPNTVTLTMIDTWGESNGDVRYESTSGVSNLIRIGDKI